MVDDMHWKIINDLVKKNKRVYIGKLDVKSIVAKNKLPGEELSKMTKRVCLLMKHYEFRQRLKNKCIANRVIYVEVDERFTSKTCSCCGEYNKNLGGDEVYDCGSCHKKMDRDINGCGCIFVKNLK